MRKFSIPYTQNDPDTYLTAIYPYKENIDSIYIGINSLCKNHLDYEIKNKTLYDTYALEFLEKSLGGYKRLLTLNSGFYPMDTSTMLTWCTSILFPVI